MNPILKEKRELVKYLGIQQTGLLNRKPVCLINDSTNSTLQFNPGVHELSVDDLHRLKKDIDKLPESELVKLFTGI